LSHIHAGRLHHVKGLASRLRMLIATGEPLPLLQLCAAENDLPLIVYTHYQPNAPRPPVLLEANIIDFALSPQAAPPFDNPVDLDVWLDFIFLRIDGRDITNHRALKEVGDTIGSHFATDVLPSVGMLKGLVSELGSKRAKEQLLYYLEVVATTAVGLGRQVLGKKDS